MATLELRWTEERIDSLITLLDERPCLHNTKIRDYFNRHKKKAPNEIAAVLGITGKLSFFHTSSFILAGYVSLLLLPT